jgi:allophanate hydrolase
VLGDIDGVRRALGADQPGDGRAVLVPLLPSPLAVGRVELADGTSVAGLVCAQRPPDAVDLTEQMSWANYVSASL